MTVPKARKRAYAPKTRSGCITCKSRRVKCDEAKPACQRCQARDLDCRYAAVPKPWVFDGTRSPSPLSSQQAGSEPPELLLKQRVPPMQFWGNEDEQRAMVYYLQRTGPLFSSYMPKKFEHLFETVFPRIAEELPAVRHLLLAVALMESPVSNLHSAGVQRHTKLIIYHYYKALSELRDPNVHYADAALAPILAFVLETLSFNEARAGMHCVGAQTALEVYGPSISLSRDEYILDERLRLFLDYTFRFRCLRCKVGDPGDDQILLAVAMRNMAAVPQKSQDLRKVFREYVDKYEPTKMMAKDVVSAVEFVRKWVIAVIQSRFLSSEPSVIFTSLQLLANLIILLLPIPVRNAVAGDETEGLGIDYVLDQCYYFMHPTENSKSVTEALKDIVTMMLQLISRGAPDPERRGRAKRLWREVVATGSIAEEPVQPWASHTSVNQVPEFLDITAIDTHAESPTVNEAE
ncbi:uncharacterized protein AB675_11142 [Cyphellophora attinorum]|uniref:Zn(2)-C6 fungal-type domain-containing protein n=1 Tax=Cyphellophora attinorum TaxID=1664694 RepID=A0A0N0NIT3_9EURO|nr:uncharacterized protein AB675_11142 [Phialophora attinorum]KPI35819.1 hypothetical protein AB675_11142 [Phialophora attinorum]